MYWLGGIEGSVSNSDAFKTKKERKYKIKKGFSLQVGICPFEHWQGNRCSPDRKSISCFKPGQNKFNSRLAFLSTLPFVKHAGKGQPSEKAGQSGVSNPSNSQTLVLPEIHQARCERILAFLGRAKCDFPLRPWGRSAPWEFVFKLAHRRRQQEH